MYEYAELKKRKKARKRMQKQKAVDYLIFVIGAIICVLSLFYLSGYWRWISCVAAGIAALSFFVLGSRSEDDFELAEILEETDQLTGENITELTLLNENDEVIAAWEMYGKTSLVIGRDVGENQVNVNLSEAAFASMIDREHAVLNYSDGRWYVEDLGSKNGISVIKSDGRKYQLAPDKPCLLDMGDILYIAMTKLLFR